METIGEKSSPAEVAGPRTPTNASASNRGLSAELESLWRSYEEIRSKSRSAEFKIFHLRKERDKAIDQNKSWNKLKDELSRESDSLRAKIRDLEASAKDKEEEIDEQLRGNEELKEELKVSRKRIETLDAEKTAKSTYLARNLHLIQILKDCLLRTIESFNNGGESSSCLVDNSDDNSETEPEHEEELREIWRETKAAERLAKETESTVNEYIDSWKKEKRELESSLVSLAEENRDINGLLRVALVEKEALERKLKGNSDQKRVPLLQFAERGLQRVVGFGFIMGGGSHEQSSESSGATTAASATGCSKSENSECEEEVDSVASTIERVMKNLRLEISELRRSLGESRSDNERLQSLTGKQAQRIEENMLYIKELEGRERVLAQNVEELLKEIKETEVEVTRWREACELEVKAGKHESKERDNLIEILKRELDKTRTALDLSTGKLKLKEELVSAAIAAQSAAEKSLQLADSRAQEFRTQIEELTKQLEEAEAKERSRRKLRHICWPWRALRPTRNTNSRFRTVSRLLPEMQAMLLRHPT